jgi:hypothetical protein
VMIVAAAAAPERRATTVAAAPAPERRAATVARAGLSIRVPAGLHIVRGKLTDLTDPNLRLAIASFRVRRGPNPCVCDTPNLDPIPHAGGVLLIWERLIVRSRGLARWYPRRPARFSLGSVSQQRSACQGPGATILFRDHGRALYAEFYLGPAASRATRAGLLAALDSLRVTR